MRIGLISDIHGNLVALDAVLAELIVPEWTRSFAWAIWQCSVPNRAR